MVDDVTTELSAHMEMEELILYPPVAKEVGEDDEEEAEIEHGLAREGLAKINEMVEAPGFGAAVEMLKAGIEHHVEAGVERRDRSAVGQVLLLGGVGPHQLAQGLQRPTQNA